MNKAVLVARGRDGLRGRGKLRPRRFLPLLEGALKDRGVALQTAESSNEASELIEGGAEVVINVFNEQSERDDIVIPDSELPPHFAINRLQLRDVLNDKRVLNTFYREHGIPTPAESKLGQPGFEIYATGTGRPPRMLAAEEASRQGHHVTKFIETSRPYKGKVYRTYVRLFAIGPYLIAANVGLRPWSEDHLSVHLMDTPLEPELINHFQSLLVDRNLERFRTLAERLGKSLGPGTYVHDTVVEAETQNIYVCETGIKFEIGEAEDYFAPVRADVPALDLHLAEYSERLADGIVCCANDHGVWTS